MDRLLPDDLRAQLEAELAALGDLADAAGDGGASDYLRFCGELARFHAHARARIRDERLVRATDSRDDETPSVRLRRETIRFDAFVLQRLLGELAVLATAHGARDGELSRLVEASASDPSVLPDMAGVAAFDGGAAAAFAALRARHGVAPAVLGYLGRLMAAPFLAEARRQRGERPEHDAREAEPMEAVRCPCCRAAPTLATLGPADGCRRLVCSMCGEVWIAPRVLCAFCGSSASLGTLRARADEPRWVETCDVCGR